MAHLDAPALRVAAQHQPGVVERVRRVGREQEPLDRLLAPGHGAVLARQHRPQRRRSPLARALVEQVERHRAGADGDACGARRASRTRRDGQVVVPQQRLGLDGLPQMASRSLGLADHPSVVRGAHREQLVRPQAVEHDRPCVASAIQLEPRFGRRRVRREGATDLDHHVQPMLRLLAADLPSVVLALASDPTLARPPLLPAGAERRAVACDRDRGQHLKATGADRASTHHAQILRAGPVRQVEAAAIDGNEHELLARRASRARTMSRIGDLERLRVVVAHQPKRRPASRLLAEHRRDAACGSPCRLRRHLHQPASASLVPHLRKTKLLLRPRTRIGGFHAAWGSRPHASCKNVISGEAPPGPSRSSRYGACSRR